MSLLAVCLLQQMVVYYLFFQAEYGIRDYKVTGVQTCALPISTDGIDPPAMTTISEASRSFRRSMTCCNNRLRSEERRVGKECRPERCTDPWNNNQHGRTPYLPGN